MRAAQLFSGKYFVSALFEVGLPGIALLAIVLLGISVSTPVYSQALQNEIAQDVPFIFQTIVTSRLGVVEIGRASCRERV